MSIALFSLSVAAATASHHSSTHDCLKHTTWVLLAVCGQAVTHTAPSRAGMVQPLLWQPLEPQYRPTAVESMSSCADDKRRVTLTDFARNFQLGTAFC